MIKGELIKAESLRVYNMKVIKPDYYDQFACIGGQCDMTCCQEWKIAVDCRTKEKWSGLEAQLSVGSELQKLSDFVRCGFGGDEIALNKDGKCPLLNECGLCNVVLAYGEEALSETCHTFPRERHEFADRVEQTLTMGCPAALDFLWAEDRFITECHECDVKVEQFAPVCDDILFTVRDEFIKLLGDKDISIADAMKMIFYIILDLYLKDEEQEVTADIIKEYFSKEYLNVLHIAVATNKSDAIDNFIEQNELFLDLAENYRKKQIYADILEPLAEKAEEYEDDLLADKALAMRKEFAAVFESVSDKIRLLLQEELYSTLVLPTADFYTLVLKIQWLGIFYAVLKQCLFLRWDSNGKLTYEDIKQITVLIIRMTGYCEDDIEEYLADCFEEIIWDWGYMALIV